MDRFSQKFSQNVLDGTCVGLLLVSLVSGRGAAWLAHQSGGLGVAGSNPVAPTLFRPVGSGRFLGQTVLAGFWARRLGCRGFWGKCGGRYFASFFWAGFCLSHSRARPRVSAPSKSTTLRRLSSSISVRALGKSSCSPGFPPPSANANAKRL